VVDELIEVFLTQAPGQLETLRAAATSSTTPTSPAIGPGRTAATQVVLSE